MRLNKSPFPARSRPQGPQCLSPHRTQVPGVGDQGSVANKSSGCLGNLQNLPLLLDEECKDKIRVYEPLSESLGNSLAQVFLQLFYDFQIP